MFFWQERAQSAASGVRGGHSGALKNVQGHVVSRDTWCPRRAVRERRRPSQDSWPSWDSTVLGQRKCPGTTRGVLGQPTPSQDGDCPGHRVSRDTFASRTPFASQDIPPDPQMSHAQLNRRAGAVDMYMTMSRTRRRNYSPPHIMLGPGPAGMGRTWLVEAGKCSRNAVNVP